MNTSIEQVRKNMQVKETKNGVRVKFNYSKEAQIACKEHKNDAITPAYLVKRVFDIQKQKGDVRFIKFAEQFYSKANKENKGAFFEAVFKQFEAMQTAKQDATGKDKAKLTPDDLFKTAYDAVYSMLLDRMQVTFAEPTEPTE